MTKASGYLESGYVSLKSGYNEGVRKCEECLPKWLINNASGVVVVIGVFVAFYLMIMTDSSSHSAGPADPPDHGPGPADPPDPRKNLNNASSDSQHLAVFPNCKIVFANCTYLGSGKSTDSSFLSLPQNEVPYAAEQSRYGTDTEDNTDIESDSELELAPRGKLELAPRGRGQVDNYIDAVFELRKKWKQEDESLRMLEENAKKSAQLRGQQESAFSHVRAEDGNTESSLLGKLEKQESDN